MKAKSRLFGSLTIFLTLVVLAMLLALGNTPSSLAREQAAQGSDSSAAGSQKLSLEAAEVDRMGAAAAKEPALYLIRLEDAPLASYRGGVAGLAATNPRALGQQKLNADSPASLAYRDYLLAKQAEFISAAERELGRSLEVAYQYYAANNGVAVWMTAAEASRVSELPGVIFVQRDVERELHTDNGPTWIGAPSIWGGSQTTRDFYAELDESQEVPPTGSDATGTGSFTYDFETNELSWSISHDVAAPTAAHIHLAPVGVNGGIEVTLDHTVNPMVGSATLTEVQESALVNGNLYVNIHTAAFPGGEIRGQIWQNGSMGEGVIIGVIDTGINPSNPSFADIGGDSYDHTNPWGTGNYVGVCDPTDPTYDPTFPCNDKLIGAWGYSSVNGGDPRDYDGHGSHTASTAGGNFVFAATVNAPTTVITRDISGVAPHANIVAYAACCTLSALTAAIDQVVVDGVDVVNYSIGSSSPSDVWNDFDTVGYLNARDAGIFVATSAGNNGPGSSTVGSPGDAPWLLTVGATTHGRSFLNVVQNMSGGNTTPPADIEGKGLTAGYGPAPIVYAGDFGDALCLNPFPAGTWTGGEIVVCDRGINARVEKGQNVLAGGAGGMVLANVEANGEGFGTLSGDSHYLPAVHITNADGLVLKAWLASGSGHMATISGTSFSDAYGDIMAGFSSRGPNGAIADIIVPSVSAPGVDIIAAYGTNDAIAWDVVSGTSMASPHAAGAAALLIATNPGWSPAEVQSVLMSTAWTDVFDNDGVTPADPFDTGNGRVDLTAAMNAGLVLDETTANYLAANPAIGGDPKTLNLPSMGNASCLQTCTWTRTVSSTLTTDQEWTVSTDAPAGMTLTVTPDTFTLAAGGSQVLTIEADVSGLSAGSWYFGQVTLEPVTTPGDVATAHFPVAVVPTTGVLPDLVTINTRRDAGSQLVPDLESIEITDLTIDVHGLAQGTQVDEMLTQDATRNDPYDNFNDGTTFFVTTEVPAGAKRLVAEIIQSTAVDMDLYVGTGDTPSAGTQICSSTTPTAIEYCNVDDPAAGTYWILVQNWDESDTPPDSVTLVYAVVAGDAGNMHVEGPASVPELTPFDLRVFWNEPAMEAGDRWYGAFDIGSDPGNPGNVGTVKVNLIRHEDDVTKSASSAIAEPGDTISYTITVQPNVTSEDLAYVISDTIPAGLTYVPGSASATAGTVSVVGNQLIWTGDMSALARRYVMSTSNEDPNCAVPLANSGAYLNLEAFNIFAQAGINGDTLWFSAFSSGAPINYWGTDHTGINFTDDGFAFFSSTPGANPWINQSIPNPDDPNNLLAAFWNDFVVVYDGPTNRGVSLANLGGTGADSGLLIEYDDVEPYPAGGTSDRMDLEVFVWRSYDDTPGSPEIIFAYDNINFSPDTGTVGIENADGSSGLQFAYNDGALLTITDGMAICFDWLLPSGDPVEITYQATVDEGTEGQTLTNEAVHNTDNPGSMPAIASASVDVPAIEIPTMYMPLLFKSP